MNGKSVQERDDWESLIYILHSLFHPLPWWNDPTKRYGVVREMYIALKSVYQPRISSLPPV